MSISLNEPGVSPLITHSPNSDIENLAKLRRALEQKTNTVLGVEKNLELFDALTQFELGQFLLLNQGLNGYWTSYIILRALHKTNLCELESWLIHRSPIIRATQERFHIFQHELQQRLRSNQTIASIPCGVMDDLLMLNYESVSNVQLVGVDLDLNSLDIAAENVKSKGVHNIMFLQHDAWNLQHAAEFDIITSNGLNIYEQDDERVIELYKEFWKALKPGGVVLTSFVTPPPSLSVDSSWKNFDADDVKQQKAIFTDVIGVGWQAFRTEDATRVQLEAAGFKVDAVIYDTQGMFPTVVASKV